MSLFEVGRLFHNHWNTWTFSDGFYKALFFFLIWNLRGEEREYFPIGWTSTLSSFCYSCPGECCICFGFTIFHRTVFLDYKIQFLDILYPGRASCSLWLQGRNTPSNHTVPFIQWSQGYLLFSTPNPGHSEINWLTHRDRISTGLFSNACGFSLFPGCLNPVGLCPSSYICPGMEETNRSAYSSGLALAVRKEYFVLMICLRQPLTILTDFCLCSSCV